MVNLDESLYLKVPHILKIVFVNLKGFLNLRQRYTPEFYKYFNEYIELWKSDIDKINTFQVESLKNLLIEAFKYSDWYNKIMVEKDISLTEITTDPFSVLKKLPFLKKEELKNNLEEIVNTNHKIIGVGHTSGTTGSPTKFYYGLEAINRSFALWKRFHKTIGLNIKERQVRLSGRFVVHPDKKKKPFWIYNYFERQLLMSTYHLTNDNLPVYIKKLNKFKPVLIDGYPTVIYVISKFINDNKLKLNFQPKAIAVTAETLYDFQRKEIEKAFNCHVYNQYASSEGSPFITECIKGKLHLNLDSGIFEFKKENGEDAKAGEVAQMIVTSFRSALTPLIRYKIEDTILLPNDNKTCSCGCQMPMVDTITGREDDILWTHERGFVTIELYKEGLDNIRKSQLIQKNPTDVIINAVVDGNFTNEMETILMGHLKERLGAKINYTINIVNDIPLSANGKFIAVKRNFSVQNYNPN